MMWRIVNSRTGLKHVDCWKEGIPLDLFAKLLVSWRNAKIFRSVHLYGLAKKIQEREALRETLRKIHVFHHPKKNKIVLWFETCNVKHYCSKLLNSTLESLTLFVNHSRSLSFDLLLCARTSIPPSRGTWRDKSRATWENRHISVVTFLCFHVLQIVIVFCFCKATEGMRGPKPRLFAFQNELPRLPVMDLEETCKRYLYR
jgi:hypothetical protein